MILPSLAEERQTIRKAFLGEVMLGKQELVKQNFGG